MPEVAAKTIQPNARAVAFLMPTPMSMTERQASRTAHGSARGERRADEEACETSRVSGGPKDGLGAVGVAVQGPWVWVGGRA